MACVVIVPEVRSESGTAVGLVESSETEGGGAAGACCGGGDGAGAAGGGAGAAGGGEGAVEWLLEGAWAAARAGRARTGSNANLMVVLRADYKVKTDSWYRMVDDGCASGGRKEGHRRAWESVTGKGFIARASEGEREGATEK